MLFAALLDLEAQLQALQAGVEFTAIVFEIARESLTFDESRLSSCPIRATIADNLLGRFATADPLKADVGSGEEVLHL